MPAGSSRPIVVRDVLTAAWRLFQVCFPVCLPLAIVGVAAGALPGAETIARGEASGYLHSATWWVLCILSLLLTLVCYGAMLRQQMALTAGDKPQLLQSLRAAMFDLPSVLLLMLAWMVPLVAAFASTAARGFDALSLLVTLAGSALLVYLLPAWPAMIAGRLGPVAALAGSIRLVRGRWVSHAALLLALVGGTLVFALLAAILINMVMSLAGQGSHPSAGALAFSRWLIDILLAVPVVYAGAAATVAWRMAVRS